MEIIWKPPSLLPGKWWTISIHEKLTAGYSHKMMESWKIGISPAFTKPKKPWLYTHGQGCSIRSISGVFNSSYWIFWQPEIQQTQLTRWLGDMYLVEIPCNLQGFQPPSQARWFLVGNSLGISWLPSMPASSQAWWVAFQAWEVGIRRDLHSSSAVSAVPRALVVGMSPCWGVGWLGQIERLVDVKRGCEKNFFVGDIFDRFGRCMCFHVFFLKCIIDVQ